MIPLPNPKDNPVDAKTASAAYRNTVPTTEHLLDFTKTEPW